MVPDSTTCHHLGSPRPTTSALDPQSLELELALKLKGLHAHVQRVLEAPEFDESTGEVECGGNCDTTTGFLKKLKSGSGVSNKGF